MVATLIVAAAMTIGARSGWDSIGSGGINQSLLPKVGEVAPDFETEDVFGNPVRLSQFRGQPVWLMFWGSWCPPCRAEFPDIQAAYAQLEPRGLRMLGVSLRESPIDAAAYAARTGATFLVLAIPTSATPGPATRSSTSRPTSSSTATVSSARSCSKTWIRSRRSPRRTACSIRRCQNLSQWPPAKATRSPGVDSERLARGISSFRRVPICIDEIPRRGSD